MHEITPDLPRSILRVNLVEDLQEAIGRYSQLLSTCEGIGCLELVKHGLMIEAEENDNEF